MSSGRVLGTCVVSVRDIFAMQACTAEELLAFFLFEVLASNHNVESL